MEEISEELNRDKNRAKGQNQTGLHRARRYISSDGLEILVGRNNRQNDHLTLRLSAPHDLWLHTRTYPVHM